MAAGLAGLLVTHAREERLRREEPEQTELHLYRHEMCQIEPAMLDKLSHAQASLEKRLREKQLDADWPAWEEHRLQAEQHLRAGRMVDSCREYCRSLRVLTEALDRQRHKEESFKPLWDRDRNHD
jgi:hypothetical protein